MKKYFQDIIEQSRCCGLLSDKELSEIQMELLLVLAEQTDKLNQGESTSVPIEKAQDIMESIMFVIGIQLKTCKTPEQAVNMLKSESLKVLFEKGMKRVKQKIALSRRLQKAILNSLLDTPNVYYRSTVEDGISGFFKLYRPQFSAHDIHITADYPVFIGRPDLDGIEFIERYLSCIHAENAFCMSFAPQDIHHLLCGLTPDYASIPLNIFEPVLLSALGLIITGHSPESLDLTENDVSLLSRQFSRQSEDDVQKCLKRSFSHLCKEVTLPQASIQYVSLCIPKLTKVILNAAKTKTLDKVFLVPLYPETMPQITFSYGDRMDNRKYQKLVEKILQTDSSENKAALILNQIHSLADLLDIMSDAELSSDDFDILINMLPIPVFAMLLSQYPNSDFLWRENEQLLYDSLQKRKRQLSTQDSRRIEQMVKALQQSHE